MVNGRNEIFATYESEDGETYYCPIDSVADDKSVSEWELDDCVEASTAARYSGNLRIVDRNIG